MTIYSAQLKFSEDQAVTVSALSTNVIDLGVAGTPAGSTKALARDAGAGNPLDVSASVTADFATLTSLTVDVRTSDNADMSSATVVASSGAIPVASLKTGTQIKFPDKIPHGANKRYLALYYTVGGTTATTGKVTAGITMGRQTNG